MSYKLHLQKDEKLAAILGTVEHELKLRKNIPVRLMASIMSQQLSTKVANVIFKRFLELFGGKEPKPKQVLDMDFDTLRAIGLSNAKTNYVKNVAAFCIEHKINDKKLLAMENEAVVELLTKIKGVGRWTVEMLLMFSLGEQDLLALDDLGIQNGMIKVYGLQGLSKKELRQKMLEIAEPWRPYRTYACLHLWHWQDNAPITKDNGQPNKV